MYKKLWGVLLLVLASLALSASAQEWIDPSYHWSGLYAGVNAGYGFSGRTHYTFGFDDRLH